MSNTFSGITAAVLTPFTANLACDLSALARHCHWLLENGCAGVSVFGTTGEGPSLSVAERRAGLDALLESGVHGQCIMPATGAAALPDALELAAHAIDSGCGGTLVVPPFYFKPVSDEGLYAFYARLIDSLGDGRMRIYLYNFPALSGVLIRHEVIARLVDDFGEIIAGLKDSSGDMAYVKRLIDEQPGLAVFTGSESLLARTLRLGGAGSISGMANVIPGVMHRVAKAHGAQELPDDAQRLIDKVLRYTTTPAIKCLAGAAFNDPAWLNLRPPLVQLDASAQRDLCAAPVGLLAQR